MTARAALLPTLAVALVAAVVGVQLASGGNAYGPAAAKSACSIAPPALPSATDSLDTITQAVVIDGVRRAACHLGTSREELLVALPSARDRAALARDLNVPETALLEELRTGLDDSLTRIDRAGALPPVSSLLDDFASQLGLPGIAVEAIKRIPASVVDELLPTGAVLRRAIDGVDMEAVLAGVNDQSELEQALVPVIRDAAIAEAKERLSDRLSSASSFFGLGG